MVNCHKVPLAIPLYICCELRQKGNMCCLLPAGPFRYLDSYGADKFVDRMKRLQEVVGEAQFQPCDLMLDYAKDTSKKFHKR